MCNWLCIGRIGLGWAYDAIYFACHMFMHFPCIRTPFQYTCYIWIILELFWLSLFSLPLSLFTLVVSMAPKRKSTPSRNPLRSETSSSSDPTHSHLRFRDDDTHKACLENFSRRGIHLERQFILADFTNTDLLMSFTVGDGSHCVTSRSPVLSCLSRIYSNMHEIDRLVPLFFTRIRGTRIPVTSQLVADVFWVPRVKFPDYSGYEHLRIVSEDELKFALCEHPSEWGEHQFTYCSGFAKGLRFLNMMMTSVLHPLFHYNSITKSRARFLLSLIEHLIIDFPSHFILSIIDVHLDSASRDKLIFPSAITRILHHFFVPFLMSNHFTHIYAIDAATVKYREAQFRL